jgi:hypothetical protein
MKPTLLCTQSFSRSHSCIAEAKCLGTSPEYCVDALPGIWAGVLEVLFGIEQFDWISIPSLLVEMKNCGRKTMNASPVLATRALESDPEASLLRLGTGQRACLATNTPPIPN